MSTLEILKESLLALLSILLINFAIVELKRVMFLK